MIKQKIRNFLGMIWGEDILVVIVEWLQMERFLMLGFVGFGLNMTTSALANNYRDYGISDFEECSDWNRKEYVVLS